MNTGSILMGRPSLGALGRATAWAPRTRTCRRSSSCPTPAAGSRAGRPAWGNGFLPAAYQGTLVRGGPSPDPAPATAGRRVATTSSGATLDFVGRAQPRAPAPPAAGDSELAARIAAYELAFRMQAHAPEVVDLAEGDRRDEARSTASTARRRPSSARAACSPGGWSSAASGSCSSTAATPTAGTPTPTSEANHGKLCRQSDRPIAGLLTDLKRRGLLDDTLVDLGRRVRPHADDRGDQRPRPQPARLHDVAGRRRGEGRAGHRRDRRGRPARGRGQGPRPRPPRHDPAPARARTTCG